MTVLSPALRRPIPVRYRRSALDLDEVGVRLWIYRLICVFWFTIPWAGVVKLAGGSTIAKGVGGLVAAVAAVAIIKSGFRERWGDFVVLVLAFASWLALSDMWSVSPPDTKSAIITMAQLVVMVMLTWEFAHSRERVLGLMNAWIAGCVVLSSLLYLSFAQHGSLKRYSVGNQHPGDLAGAMLIAIVLAWYLSLKTNRPAHAVAYRLFVVFEIGAVALTASRAALLTLVVALAIIPATTRVTSQRARLGVLSAIVAAAVAVPLFVTAAAGPIARLSTTSSEISSGTLDNRTTLWSIGLNLLERHPVLGLGSGASNGVVAGQYVSDKELHNTFLTISVELGLVGLVLFALILLTAVWRAARWTPWLERRMVWVLTAVFIIQLVPRSADHAKTTWAILVLLALIGTTMVPRRRPVTPPDLGRTRPAYAAKNPRRR